MSEPDSEPESDPDSEATEVTQTEVDVVNTDSPAELSGPATELLSVEPVDSSRTSPGITSPMADDLVNNILSKVTTEEIPSSNGDQAVTYTSTEQTVSITTITDTASSHETSDSPTSPFANQLVDDMMQNIQSEPNTARSDMSDTITQVTEEGNDDTKSGKILEDVYLIHEKVYLFKLIGKI